MNDITNSNNTNYKDQPKKRVRVTCEHLKLVDIFDNKSQFQRNEEDNNNFFEQHRLSTSPQSLSSCKQQPQMSRPKPVNIDTQSGVPTASVGVSKSPKSPRCIVRYKKKRIVKVTRETRLILVKETLDTNHQVVKSRTLMDKSSAVIISQSEKEKMFGEKKVPIVQAENESDDDERLSLFTDDLDTVDGEESQPVKKPSDQPFFASNLNPSVSDNASSSQTRSYKTHHKLLLANRYNNGQNENLSEEETNTLPKPAGNQSQLNLRNRSVAKPAEPNRSQDEYLKYKYKVKYGKEAESIETNDTKKSKICSFSDLKFKLTPKERRDDLNELRKATSSNVPVKITPDAMTPRYKPCLPFEVLSSTIELNPDYEPSDGENSQKDDYFKRSNTFSDEKSELVDMRYVKNRTDSVVDDQKRTDLLKNVSVRVKRLDEDTFKKYYSKYAPENTSQSIESSPSTSSNVELLTPVDGPFTEGEYVFAQMANGNYYAAQIEKIKDYYYAGTSFGLLYKCKYFNFKNDRELEELRNDESMTRSQSGSDDVTILNDSNSEDYLTQSQLIRPNRLRKNYLLQVYSPKTDCFKVGYFLKISGSCVCIKSKRASTRTIRFPFQMVVIPQKTIEAIRQIEKDEISRKSEIDKIINESNSSSNNNTSTSSNDSIVRELRSSMKISPKIDSQDTDKRINKNNDNSKTHRKLKSPPVGSTPSHTKTKKFLNNLRKSH